MRRRRRDRTAHLRPFCRVCGNTRLVEGPIETHDGRDYTTMKPCDKCPTSYPTSVHAPPPPDPGPDFKTRAAGGD